MQDITHILADLTAIDGQPMTDSLKVAARFGKDHSKVLRSINTIKADQPEFHQANFGEVFDAFTNGNGAKQSRKVYRMTKDGFVFLSMGFTGKEASAFKIAYIGAFNAMAEQIADAARVPAIPATVYEQALDAEKAEALSFRAASDAAKIMRARKEVKPVLVQQLEMMREAVQLCLMLGLTKLPDVD